MPESDKRYRFYPFLGVYTRYAVYTIPFYKSNRCVNGVLGMKPRKVDPENFPVEQVEKLGNQYFYIFYGHQGLRHLNIEAVKHVLRNAKVIN